MLRAQKETQIARIDRLRKEYPATCEYRVQIRNFVARCSVTFVFDEPVLDVGSGYRSNEPEICTSRLLEFYTLELNRELEPDFLCSAENMNIITSNTFGCVVCTELLEHVQFPRKVMSEIYRVMKNDGLLILTVPFWFPIHEKSHQPDYWRFTPEAVKLLLEGFRIEVLETSGEPDTPVGVFAAARKCLVSAF